MNLVNISQDDNACILDNKKSVPPIFIKPVKPFLEFLSKKLCILIDSISDDFNCSFVELKTVCRIIPVDYQYILPCLLLLSQIFFHQNSFY